MQNYKIFYKSKFFWFGFLFILNSTAQLFGYGDWIPGGELDAVASFITGLLIWALRLRTTVGVKLF